MIDDLPVSSRIQFQPLQHLILRFIICGCALLIRRLMRGTSSKLVGSECLKLDSICTAALGGVDQSQSKVERSVVIYSGFSNYECVRHQGPILSGVPDRTKTLRLERREQVF
jgi:hypothetical protein